MQFREYVWTLRIYLGTQEIEVKLAANNSLSTYTTFYSLCTN